MRKILLLLISMSFLSCGVTGTKIQKTETQIYNPTQKNRLNSTTFPVRAFVKVYKTLHILSCHSIKNTKCKKGDKFISTGSGISIGTTKESAGSLLMTAGHVCVTKLTKKALKAIKKFEITISAHNIYGDAEEAKVIHLEERPDLCLLYSKGLETKGVFLAEKPPNIGDKVFSLSAPAGIFHPPTMPILEGRYSGPVDSKNINMMVTLPAIGGSSGSGIINSDMKLIGILFATHPFFNIVTLSSSYHSTSLFINEGFKKFLKESNKN